VTTLEAVPTMRDHIDLEDAITSAFEHAGTAEELARLSPAAPADGRAATAFALLALCAEVRALRLTIEGRWAR
jgi:hypothetical protein